MNILNQVRRRSLFLLLLTTFASGAAMATDPSELPDGTDIKGAADHPLIQRFAGSSIRHNEKKAFDEVRLALGPATSDGVAKTLTVEGQRTTLVYVMPKDVSPLEAIRGYQAELAKQGTVEVLFQGANTPTRQDLQDYPNAFSIAMYGEGTAGNRFMPWNEEFRYAALKIKRADGDAYVAIYAGFNTDTSAADSLIVPFGRVAVRLDVVEPKPMAARMVTVKADEMSTEIRKSGRVALYGILFDTNKTEIKPESTPALLEISKLLAADAKLNLLVVGHTDSVGAFEANRDLSQRRAQAVVAALVAQYKVSAKRLLAFGASSASPAASNDSEQGRARNRRVELVSF